MSKAVAIAILADHSVPCREAGEWLEVLDTFTVYAVGCGRWVPCPTTADVLYSWLGY